MKQLGVRFVPLSDLIRRLEASVVPSGRDDLFILLDEFQRRVEGLFGADSVKERILRGGVVELLLRGLKVFRLDGPMILSLVKLLKSLCADDALAQRVLDVGGREQLETTSELNAGEKPIVRAVNRLLSTLKRHASYAAKVDAHRVSVLAKFCACCLPLAEHEGLCGEDPQDQPSNPRESIIKSRKSRRSKLLPSQISIGDEVEDGDAFWGNGKKKQEQQQSPAERIESNPLRRSFANLLHHMRRYPTVPEVQVSCMEGFISLGKMRETPTFMLEGDALALFVQVMRAFAKDVHLTSKGCLAATYLCKHDSLCSDLGRYGLVAVLAEVWKCQRKEPSLRQPLLWAFSEISRLEANQIRCQQEGVANLLRPVLDPAPQSPDSVNSTLSRQVSPESDNICIPLKLRRLYDAQILGSPYAKEAAAASKSGAAASNNGKRKKKAGMFGRVGDDEGEVQGPSGLF